MIEKFQMAYQTELGTVFLVLMFFLVVLSGLYLYLKMRQKEQDNLRYQFNSYYDSAERIAKDFQFSEKHLVEFFGRETIVQVKYKQKPAVCVIPPPNLATEEIRSRFQAFQRAFDNDDFHVFAPCEWSNTNYSFIVIQGNLLHDDGRKLLSINKYLRDGKITDADKEKVLLELARALARLHERTTENGVKLYHGFLTSRSVLVDIDASHQLKRIVVANLGLSFAFGPNVMQERLKGIKSGKIKIDKWMTQELVDQMTMLAPEQLDPERTSEVGTPCDFFAFAALAVSVFTEQKFKGRDQVDWDSISEKWAPFLQNCLHNKPSDRPRDFNELEEWLSDPELGLTHHGSEVVHHDWEKADLTGNSEYSEGQDGFDVEAIQQLSSNAADDEDIDDQDPFNQNFIAGNKALKMGKWKVAVDHFQKAVKIDESNNEAKINLAICCYELGEMNDAESYYRSVKSEDPEAAKVFRKHIAFRV
ncbi:MAG: tetratricopeptide repeat protein [Chlamydiota bacterium]|nr:tetratricopeptide repeat protein [Chlamydiota bacterium]